MAKSTEIPTAPDAIRKALRSNTTERAKSAAKDAELLAERDKLFIAARDAEPPIVIREIAQLTDLTEVAVNKRIKQIRG